MSPLYSPNAATDTSVTWDEVSGKPTAFAPSTHGHPFSDITGIVSTAQLPSDVALDQDLTSYQPKSEKGTANGYAGLGTDGKVPAAQLPASGGGVPTVKKTADQASSLLTYSDITGLGFTLLANTSYEFKYRLIFQSSSTTNGFGFSLNGPLTPPLLHYEVRYQTTANATAGTSVVTSRMDTAYDAMPATAATIAQAVNLVCMIEGLITTGAVGGTLIPRFRGELTTANITVKAGSVGRLFG